MDANCFAKCEFVTLSKKIGDIVGQERVKQERKWEENLHDVEE